MRQRFVSLLCLCAALWAGGAEARQFTSQITEPEQLPRIHPDYPLPQEPNQLFYVERSSNSNTVIYAAGLDGHGAIDPKNPVQAYWRWYNVDGHRKDLNFVEKLMAYGVHVDAPKPGRPVTFSIAALPERVLTLDLDEQKHPEVLIQIGGRAVKLAYVYLEVIDGLVPKVPSFDIFGTDRTSGKPVHEHVVQN